MKQYYDLIFITNLPSFYKIKLYNEIALQKKILVIYTGDTAKERNKNFFNGTPNFRYYYLQGNILKKIYFTIQILLKLNYNHLVLGGWDSLIMWIANFFSSKRKNGVIIESTCYESSTKGLKYIIKQIFLSHTSIAFTCGSPHSRLIKKLKFKGKIIETGGVGLINCQKRPHYIHKNTIKNFLYVGRLVDVKNIEFLIQEFNQFPELNLTIVGEGKLESYLKSISNNNITFLGHINNEELPNIYKTHDVFILPSLSETWGLVVEEALNNGLPVIVSNRVGCHENLIKENYNGFVYAVNDHDMFKKYIKQITKPEIYNRLVYNISNIDFQQQAYKQISSFVNLS